MPITTDAGTAVVRQGAREAGVDADELAAAKETFRAASC